MSFINAGARIKSARRARAITVPVEIPKGCVDYLRTKSPDYNLSKLF
jgi:hypothetical protein